MRKGFITVVLLLACAAPGAAQRARRPVTHTVTIDGTRFSPATLTIKPGDSVVWVNKDIVAHTATSAGPGGFESGMLETGKSWKKRFIKKGELPYACRYHPAMTARLVVE